MRKLISFLSILSLIAINITVAEAAPSLKNIGKVYSTGAKTSLATNSYKIVNTTSDVGSYSVRGAGSFSHIGSASTHTAAHGAGSFANTWNASVNTTARTSGFVRSGAESAKQAANLSTHLKYSQEYGKHAVKELQNGRYRYYGNIESAKKQGEMIGRRYVHEFNAPKSQSRGWHETLDQNKAIRQVRPQLNNGKKVHYTFDKNGKYTGSW